MQPCSMLYLLKTVYFEKNYKNKPDFFIPLAGIFCIAWLYKEL